MRARVLLGALGLAAAAYGGWLLLDQDYLAAAVWLAAGVLLHDFVLVPLTLGLCWLGLRVLPPGRGGPVAAGLLVLGSLTIMAVPVLGGWGANADNATILDRDYAAGWLTVAAVTIMVVLLATIVGLVAKGRRSGGPGARRR